MSNGSRALRDCARRCAGASRCVTFVPVSAQQAETGRPRRDLQDQRGRVPALAGDGDHELAHRRLRSAAHELARLPQGRRLGGQGDDVLGPRQRQAAAVRTVRPRLGERQVLHDGDDAGRQPAGHRLPAGVDVEHQRRRLGRRRLRDARHARGPRHLEGQAERQVRAVDGDAATCRRSSNRRRSATPQDQLRDLERETDCGRAAAAADGRGGSRRRPRRRRRLRADAHAVPQGRRRARDHRAGPRHRRHGVRRRRRLARSRTRQPRCRRSRSPSSTTAGSLRTLAEEDARHGSSSTSRTRSTTTPCPSTSSARFRAPTRPTRSSCSARTSTRGTRGTGATDNAAGSAVMMEAMRILKQSGLPLRRTVRIGLWGGEEQGLHRIARSTSPRRSPTARRWRSSRRTRSSRATSTSTTAPARSAASTCRATRRVAPIFEAWMKPFNNLGMTHADDSRHRRHRSPGVRRRRPARLPVHPGSGRVRHAHAPLEHGRLRADPGRGHAQERGDRRGVRLPRREPRPAAAAQAAAQAGARRRRTGPAEGVDSSSRQPAVTANRGASRLTKREGRLWRLRDHRGLRMLRDAPKAP